MKHRALLFAPIVAILFSAGAAVAPPARADEIFTFVVKKQEEKAKKRWSLSEWIETRDKMRLMDLWLALHSPSPYEFFVGGSYRMFDGPAGRPNGWSIQGAAYASIFGLGVERTLGPAAAWSGEFLFRIFGFHAQGTNITLHAGIRSQDDPAFLGEAVRNGYAGAALSIYLARFFGLEALYRRHFAPSPNASGLSSASAALEGGAFIDFSFLRLSLTLGSNTPDGSTGTTQTSLGTRIFF